MVLFFVLCRTVVDVIFITDIHRGIILLRLISWTRQLIVVLFNSVSPVQ